MKSILKTVPKDLEMKYDEKFGSEINNEIMQDLIPLYLANDERITQYNREQLLGILENNQYHSRKIRKWEKEKGLCEKLTFII